MNKTWALRWPSESYNAKQLFFLLCSRMQALVKREVIYPEIRATTKMENLRENSPKV